MTAIIDDIFEEYRANRSSNDLFALVWGEHDTDHPGIYPVIAISFHSSTAQQQLFRQELYSAYDRRWGNSVPPTYYGINASFKVGSSADFLSFTQVSLL